MKTIKIKAFLISLIGQFLITFFLHAGVRLPNFFNFLVIPNITWQQNLTSSLASSRDPVLQLRPKLEQMPNNFTPSKSHLSLVKEALAAEDYDQATSYLVMDFDSGQVLDSKDSTKSLPIASLTKLMTAVVALDLAAPDEVLTISSKATKVEPTTIGVVADQKMKTSELISGMLITSANDAAQAVEDGINQKYNQDIFEAAMNTKAKFLGLSNTHFTNPQGYDSEKNYSSTQDLAILAHYALTNYPLISDFVKKDYLFLPESDMHKQFDLYNWNGLLGVYPGAFGVKIGNTDNARYTTIVAAQRQGKKILVVLLGAPGVLERDLWAAKLLDLGFAKYGLTSVNVTEVQLKQKYSTWKYWG